MSLKALSEGLLLSASQCWFSKVPASQIELVSFLKQSGILKTPEVISTMEKHDRRIFTTEESVYENKPLNIGNGEVMTTPSTHALTLELLYPSISQSKILDLGCGTGYLSQCFAHLNPQGMVRGVDFHKNLINRAKEINKHPNLEFRHCDAFEIIDDHFDIIHVGFAASEDLYKFLVEKANNRLLLCPVKREEVIWVVNYENKEQVIGEVGFSEMRVHENLKVELEGIEKVIKKLYDDTEKVLGRKPHISEMPSEIHGILKKWRQVQAKAKKMESYQVADKK